MGSVLEYQTAVMRRDFETADRVLPSVPKEQRTRVAHFLEKQGFKQQALAVSADPEHRFELSLQLGDLKIAYQLANEAQSEHKWKQLADIATSKCQFDMAQECLHKAQDFGGLLLLATASGNAEMVKRLGDDAIGAGMNNVAFLTRFLSGDLNACLEILQKSNRIPEAAFFARTYLPSQISRVVQLWKVSLGQVNAKAAQSLADPQQYENLFPGLTDALKTEQFLAQKRALRPASAYTSLPANWDRKPIEEMEQAEDSGLFHPILSGGPQEEEEEHFAEAEGKALTTEATQVMEKNIADMEQLAISGQEQQQQQQLLQQQQQQPPVVPELQPVVAAKEAEKSLLDDEDEEFHDTAKTAILDHELEMDLASLEYDENVDTSEINLDDDLLDD